MNSEQKQRRQFSAAFKQEKVALLDEGKVSVKELSEIYDVSKTAIYKWIRKYSKLKRDERVVVEKISEAQKTLELKKKIGELERILGKKQLEIDYLKTSIDIYKHEQGEDTGKK